MQNTYPEYAQRLTQKHKATDAELARYHPLDHGRSKIEVEGREYLLEREDERDTLDAEEKNQADTDQPCWNSKTNAPENAGCQDTVDHRPAQSAVRDQEDRGTCVCFAALANLEALLSAAGNPITLSPQYANWLFMALEGNNQCDDGLRTTLAARYLSLHGVCEEPLCTYEDLVTVQMHCTSEPARQAQAQAIYGIGQYALINRLGLFGPSIANPEYLEASLCHNHDIVFGTSVAWVKPDANAVYDVALDQYGNPLSSRGGHAMLIVGYVRNAPIPYFIVKNSWGAGDGVNGYRYLSYDYVRTYAKYGYIVLQVRQDMSASPSAQGIA